MSTNDMEIEFHQLDLRYEGLRVRRLEREKRLLSSLAERGQQVAIVVVRLQDEPNRYLVIDGYKRIRALQKLGWDTVNATVWDMSEAEALILDRSLRTAEGETALEQAWLLSELHSSMEMSLEDLALRFDRSKSWVSRRLALVCELPQSVQHYVRLGKIGAHAAMKYLVPIARTNKSSCERLAEEIARHQFSGVWTQAVLICALSEKYSSDEQYHKAVIRLILLKYRHTTINGTVILEAAKQANWANIRPLTEVLETLRGPQMEIRSTVIVLAEFMFLLWQQPILDFQRDTIITAALDIVTARRDPAKVIQQVRGAVHTRFRLLPLAEMRIHQIISAWELLRIRNAVLF